MDTPEGTTRERRGIAKFWPLLILLVFLSVAVFYGANLSTRAEVGRPIPAFSLPDIDGAPVDSAQFLGRPVIMNFWATWCPVCRYETPAHQAVIERFGDEFAYVAINLREPADKVRRHREEFAAQGIALDGRLDLLDRRGQVFNLFRFTGTPETWVVDAEGRAVHHFIGGSTFEDLVLALERAGLRLWFEPATGWVSAVAFAKDAEGSPGMLWLGADGGLFRVTSPYAVGQSESPVVERIPIPVREVRSLAADGNGEGVWAVARRGEDDGSGGWMLLHWTDEAWQTYLDDAGPIAVAVGNEGRIYAWTSEKGLLVSDDGGRSWVERAVPFQPTFAGLAMAVDPWNEEHVLSGGPGGVWRTRDGGFTWERTDIQHLVDGIAFDPGRPGRAYFAYRGGVLVSDDGGRTAREWTTSPQRHLVGVAVGPGWDGPVGVAANGDVYAAGEAEGHRWTLWPGFLGTGSG